MEKLDYETVYNYIKGCGYTIIGEYKNSNTYVLVERDDGIRCFVSYTNLKCGKSPIIWGKYNYSNLSHNISILIKQRKSGVELIGWKIISKNGRNRCLLHLRCSCGKEYNKTLEDFVYKTYLECHDCANKKRGYTKRNKNYKKVIIDAGYRLMTSNDDFRYFDYVEVEDLDGYKGFISAANIKSGKGMSRFDVRINKKYYIENVNVWAFQNGIDSTCLEFDDTKQYKRQSLRFRCGCGNEFVTSIASFQNGKLQCDICANRISSLEKKFRKYLDDNKYSYIYQYSLNDCRDVLPLPFDFFLKDYNILVEIDGQGHYYPCNFNQISQEKAIKTFEITKKHDKIKTKYCLDANKKLIRIPYWLFDKNDSFIEFFQKSLND